LTVCSAVWVNLGEFVMADRVYSLVKGPAGWVLFLDGARFGGTYGTKEAAFEATMVAASFIVGVGDGVQINVPSEANMRAIEKPPWPKDLNETPIAPWERSRSW
jgi:hypothetical protein